VSTVLCELDDVGILQEETQAKTDLEECFLVDRLSRLHKVWALFEPLREGLKL